MKPDLEAPKVVSVDRRAWLKRTALAGIGGVLAGFLAGRVQAAGSPNLVFQDDYIWMKALTVNPSPLPQGGFWWRDDLGRILYSPDGAATRQVSALEDALSSFTGGGITDAQHGARGAITNAHAFSDLNGGITDAQHGSRTQANAHKYTDLDFTLSNLTSIATRNHADLGSVSADQHHAQLHKAAHVSGGGDAFVSTDFLDAIVSRLRVTGPVDLLIGAVADGQFLKRSGTSIVGDTPGGASTPAFLSITKWGVD